MKDAVLLELATRWELDARPPKDEDGSPEGASEVAARASERATKRECADTLRVLIGMLGEESNTSE